MLTADVDYLDMSLEHASMALGGLSGRPHATFVLAKHGAGFAYSIDGQRWGRFVGQPDIFDLAHFEDELRHVPVTDVTIEQAIEARRLREALDVDLDPSAFDRLLRVFSADRERDIEDLDLGAFSVTLAGAEDLSLLYWWSLTGTEEDAPAAGRTQTYAVKVTCSVTIRLAELRRLADDEVRLDEAMPEVAHIDEIWARARSGEAEPGA